MSGGDLGKLRSIADYQYGHDAGQAVFPDGTEFVYSRNTGRVRHAFLGGVMQATFRPSDGAVTLTVPAAQRLVNALPDLGYTVTVEDDVAEFIRQGRNVFAKHVASAGEKIRPGDETIVLDSSRRVLGLGKALLNRAEMLSFKTGVAVKVRRGNEA